MERQAFHAPAHVVDWAERKVLRKQLGGVCLRVLFNRLRSRDDSRNIGIFPGRSAVTRILVVFSPFDFGSVFFALFFLASTLFLALLRPLSLHWDTSSFRSRNCAWRQFGHKKARHTEMCRALKIDQ
jgi:hypothetical protein